jgi:hypothetical protein
MRALVFALSLLWTGSAIGQSPAGVVGSTMGGQQGAKFSVEEVLTIQSFFRGPGAANRPPLEALERQLAPSSKQMLKPGGTLTKDLKRKCFSLPSALENALPSTRGGGRRVVLGKRVLMVDRNDSITDLMEISFEPEKPPSPKTAKK